jgi:hypothetical protein
MGTTFESFDSSALFFGLPVESGFRESELKARNNPSGPSGPLYCNSAPLNSGAVSVLEVDSWTPLGWDQSLLAMHDFNGSLVIGGNFPTPELRVARYNVLSGTWESVGAGIPDGYVAGLTTFNNELIAVGGFTNVRGIPCWGLAHFDGTLWQSLGDPEAGGLPWLAATAHADGLYIVGGNPTGSVGRIKRWDGEYWYDVGPSYPAGPILDVASFNGEIYICGRFSSIGALSTPNGCARWNGATWFAESVSGFDAEAGWPQALHVWNNNLFAAGVKPSTQVSVMQRMAEEQPWEGRGAGPFLGGGNQVELDSATLETLGSVLVLASWFSSITYEETTVPTQSVAAFDGTQWHDLHYNLPNFGADLAVGVG